MPSMQLPCMSGTRFNAPFNHSLISNPLLTCRLAEEKNKFLSEEQLLKQREAKVWGIGRCDALFNFLPQSSFRSCKSGLKKRRRRKDWRGRGRWR